MTASTHNPDRLHELIRRQLDESLDQEEFAEFSQLLLDHPAAIDEYLAIVSLQADLEWEFLRSPIASAADIPHPALQHTLDHTDSPARKSGRRRLFATAVVVAIALAILGIIFKPGSPEIAAAANPIITHIQGNVLLSSNEAQSSIANTGNRIPTGMTVRTDGNESFAVLAYDDGSQVLLTGDVNVKVQNQGGRNHLSLNSGVIAASISHRPAGQPIVFDTPQVRVDGLGTQFSLAATSLQTDVKVSEGRVNLTRLADGQSVIVPKGKRLSTDAKQAELVATENQPSPDTWREDFERGAHSDWIRGDFVTSGLPPGSHGGIKAAFATEAQVPGYGISTPHPWVDGLFVVHPDSHLTFTYKMQRPEWINIFFITRTSDPSSPQTFLHKFNGLPTHPTEANRWKTVTIPFSEFQRRTKHGFGDVPPQPGELVFGISWTAPEPDRGLVIDRVSVTRGGPGKIRFKESPQ